MSQDDDLPHLSSREPSADLDARVRRLALAEMSLAGGPRWRAMSARLAKRVVVPGAIALTVAGYLHWAVASASSFYR